MSKGPITTDDLVGIVCALDALIDSALTLSYRVRRFGREYVKLHRRYKARRKAIGRRAVGAEFDVARKEIMRQLEDEPIKEGMG